MSSITTFFVSLNLYYISCFRATAIARNLLEDDSTWERVMQEAGAFQMPVAMRQLFVDICCLCSPTNALLLFENNLLHLTEDYIRSGHNPEIAKKSLTEVYSRRSEDEWSNFRRVLPAVARFSDDQSAGC